jgi:hypothetical protein
LPLDQLRWFDHGNPGGGTPTEPPSLLDMVIGTNADGRLELFVLDSSQEVWHKWQDLNLAWSAWESLGKPTSVSTAQEPLVARELTVAPNENGRLEVFVLAGGRGTGSVFHIWQTAPNAGWGKWKGFASAEELNPGLHDIVSTSHEDGRLAVFLNSTNERSAWGIMRRSQSGANGDWHDWSDPEGSPAELGGLVANSMVVGRGLGGQIQVFVLSARSFFWWRWQLNKNAGFSDFYLFAPPFALYPCQDLLLAPNQDGHLELFTIGGDGAVYHTWQTGPEAWWYEWVPFADPQPGEIFVPVERGFLGAALNGAGLLSLFHVGSPAGSVRNSGSTVWCIEQLGANANRGDWVSMGASDTRIGPGAVGTNAQGLFELFVISDNKVWQQWQTSVNSVTVWQPGSTRASWFAQIIGKLMG